MTDQLANLSPNPVDMFVGGKVRMRRKSMGMSQEVLAASIDLTFQQVQKYERGSNRISASKLYQIADTLKVPVSYFFEGFSGAPAEPFAESESEVAVSHFLLTSEGLELAQSFPKIRGAKLRRRVLDLVRTLSEEDAAAAQPVA